MTGFWSAHDHSIILRFRLLPPTQQSNFHLRIADSGQRCCLCPVSSYENSSADSSRQWSSVPRFCRPSYSRLLLGCPAICDVESVIQVREQVALMFNADGFSIKNWALNVPELLAGGPLILARSPRPTARCLSGSCVGTENLQSMVQDPTAAIGCGLDKAESPNLQPAWSRSCKTLHEPLVGTGAQRRTVPDQASTRFASVPNSIKLQRIILVAETRDGVPVQLLTTTSKDASLSSHHFIARLELYTAVETAFAESDDLPEDTNTSGAT